MALAGCSHDAQTKVKPNKRLAGVKLRLVVVDDPAIAAAARGLRDEWNAQTGAEVEVVEAREQQISASEPLPGDVLICPEHLLGPLAEAQRLAPLPRNIAGDPHGLWSQTFNLLRNQAAVWGNEIYGVPLGSPVFCCYCRAEVLEKLHRKPPQTWKEYDELAWLILEKEAAHGGGEPGSTVYGTVAPLARGWAGLVLLARAAAYAKVADNYTTLFDEKTLEPAIAGPPFVRALEELVAAARQGSPEQLDLDPAAVRDEFWKGRAVLAITWPSAAKGVRPSGPTAAAIQARAPGTHDLGRPDVPSVVFAELPGATEFYQPANKSWEPRGDDADSRVPLLGIAGRIGLVSAASEHADAAFELLLWLTDPQWANQVFAASPATTLFRRGQVASPRAWVESGASATAAKQYADQTAETLSRRQFLAALRIPGRSEYLAALDEAVQAAVRGKQTPAAALTAAAAKWREVSQRLGIERQRTAYLHSLGLEP